MLCRLNIYATLQLHNKLFKQMLKSHLDMQLKVGLEIHGYIQEASKLFCDCQIVEQATPNTHICPVCTGQPGAKPQATNAIALQKAVQIALMLKCQVNKRLLFQRKHYSWPDSPNNFQRTMSGSYASPVGENGLFEGIRIRQVHLEEDPARWDPVTGQVDYNRAGHPLIEIVTEPDFSDSTQVREWLEALIATLAYLKAINKSAGIKSDVNVSIGPEFERVEIKNVNSQSAIVDAILYESNRQASEKEQGNRIPMQTRTWDEAKQQTLFMRSKESAQDYMFIPEPDVPYIDISQDYLDKLQSALPQTPSQKRELLMAIGLSEDDAKVLSHNYELVELFEAFQSSFSKEMLVTYLRREIVRIANYNKRDVDQLILDKKQLFSLFTLLSTKKITDNVARKILEKLLLETFDVETYVAEHKLSQISDNSTLEQFCREAIAKNQQAVADYKTGNEKALNFLVGQIMRQTRGTASIEVVLAKLKEFIQ